jgi:hypothetical protein
MCGVSRITSSRRVTASVVRPNNQPIHGSEPSSGIWSRVVVTDSPIRPPSTSVWPSRIRILVVISVVLSDGMPDTGSTTPALFCGCTSMRIHPSSPRYGRNVSCVPVSRKLTCSMVLVWFCVTVE